MDKYVKLIENQIEFAPQNKGSIINYNTNVELMKADGYKLFVETERPVTNRMYHIGYNETSDEIQEVIIYDETQEAANERKLEQHRQEKIFQNEALAKEHLVYEITIPVTEDEILCTFICNEQTERNLNSASVMLLGEVIEKKKWTDEKGTTVMLRKEDIVAVGLRFNLHTDKIWELWGEYEEQIKEAQTIEEIDAIELNYEINEELN